MPISARARSAAANSRTASSSALEPRRDLRERVQTRRHVGRVAALDAGVEVRERVLLGVRPVPARGGQAAEGEARPRRKQAIAELRSALAWRLQRRGLGAAVREQALCLGKQAERPRRHDGVASLDQRHQALEPVAGLLGPAGGQLGKGDRESRHGTAIPAPSLRVRSSRAGRRSSGRSGSPCQASTRPSKRVRKCLQDRLPGGRHRRSQPLDRLARFGEATVELSHHSDHEPAPGDLEGVAQPLGQRGDLLVGAGGLRVLLWYR